MLNILYIIKIIGKRNNGTISKEPNGIQLEILTDNTVNNDFHIKSQIKQESNIISNSMPYLHSDANQPDELDQVNQDARSIPGCKYCLVFSQLGTAICPNCGRVLNLNHTHLRLVSIARAR